MPRLKIFNEALVDHYCPERAISAVKDPDGWFGIKEFIHSYRQKKDFKKALAYAETTILRCIQNPELRPRLKGEHFEKWIKELHRLAGKTVLSDWNCPSGEYITQLVFRWEKGVEFSVSLAHILNNFHHNKQKRNELVVQLFKESGLELASSEWIKIIEKAEQGNYPIFPSFMPTSRVFPSTYILTAMACAKEQGLLTPAQTRAVDKICKIVLPHSIPDKMKEYAAFLAKEIIKCDGKLDSVVRLAAVAFRDLTKIHPFPNANGRVSTINLNLILVGFEYPSIVLRTQQDLDDEQSEYNQVVSKMDEDLDPLIKFIKKKVAQNKQEADKGTIESTPAKNDDSYLLSDALFALVKEFKQKEKSQKNRSKAMPSARICVSEPSKLMNFYLKTRLDDIGFRFGFDSMYLPAYVEYTEEELIQVKTSQLKL